jgi:elongation factor Ts
MVLTGDQVAPEVLEREKEIIRAQPDMAGKPADIVEKMMGGRIKKFLKDVSLVDQPFVKNPDQTVAQFAKAGGAEILSFTRFEVGEGIEVTKVDFAEEVKAQAKAGA